MLDSYKEIISTLKSLNDYYYLKSNFIISPKLGKFNINEKEPFRYGFLEGMEIRNELLRRLNNLKSKEKDILLLFYTFGKPMEYIGEKLNLSCRQCYRIKKKALEKIIYFEETKL